MKKLNLFAIVVLLTIAFSSCSTNETLILEEQSLDLLKTYTIKRDANGAYSVDLNLGEGSEVQKTIDPQTNTNQFYLHSSVNKSARRITEDVSVQEDQLKIGFIETNTDNLSQIILTDDDITFAKKNDTDKLKEYSISSNLNGTFNLNFNVKDNVRVDFVYNEESAVYEVHLEDGNGKKNDFNRVLEKVDGQPLKFVFVNHIINFNAKSGGGEQSLIRKPQGIIM